MDDSSVVPGGSVHGFPQTLPSVATVERQSQAALQRARSTSAALPKPATPAEPHQAKPSEGLAQEVAFANAVAELLSQRVSFNYDERIDQIVVKVTRGTSEEVIRQIPSEEMIKLMAKFRRDFRGLIFDRTG